MSNPYGPILKPLLVQDIKENKHKKDMQSW